MNDSKHSITRAAGTMSLATGLSRILGLVRDKLSAYFFGAGWVSDAFIMAFRIPNLLRDMLAEGALSAAFVPAMTKERQARGKEGAWRLASLMLNSMIMLMAALTLLGVIFSPALVGAMAGGFKARPEQFELTVLLTRILFPFLSMMVFSSLLMGILISRNHFVTGAIAPVFLNLTMLLVGLLIYFCQQLPPERKVLIWAGGYLAAGLVQFLVHVPPVLREGFRWRLAWPFKDAGVKKIWGQLLPAVLGQSSTQINLWINSWLASNMAIGSVSYIYYGNRMMQLPLGIFAVAISTAVLPTLSSQHGSEDRQAFKKTLGFGMRLTLFITLPAAAGLILLSEPINVLLFKGGLFGIQDALNAAAACRLYSVGIIFAALIKVLVPAFYAREEASLAVKVSMLGVLVNLGASFALKDSLGFRALALATTLSLFFQAALLVWLLRRRLGSLLREEMLVDFLKIVACTLLMCLTVWASGLWLRQGLDPAQIYSRWHLFEEVLLGIGLACLVYFPLAHAWGVDYLAPLLARRGKKV
jgi:putative peptidoglycan lipid II flippase